MDFHTEVEKQIYVAASNVSKKKELEIFIGIKENAWKPMRKSKHGNHDN